MKTAIALCCALAVSATLLAPGCESRTQVSQPEPQQQLAESATATTETAGGVRLTVTVSSTRLVAGTSEVASMTLVNTGETTSVPPPRFGLTITDTSGKVVFANQPQRVRHPAGASYLGTGVRLTEELTFTVPAPGRYLLYANAAGLVTPPLELEGAAKSN